MTESSTDLEPRVAAALAYLAGPFSGALILWVETRNEFVRFHARQSIIGLGGAVLMGIAIYKGALKINLGRFFRYTGILLIIVAAGILAYGIHDLQEAGFLPGMNNLAFDVSDTVDINSWYGALLKGVFNFSPATTKLEAAAWLAYAVPVMTLFLVGVRRRTSAAAAAARPVRSASSV